MDSLSEDYYKVSGKTSLLSSIRDLQRGINLLEDARDAVDTTPSNAPIILAKIQNMVKQSLDDVNNDLKSVYHSLNKYSKALDKMFKDKSLPASEYDALSSQSELISRAIGMHFLREGQFSVASTFFGENSGHKSQPAYPEPQYHLDSWYLHANTQPLGSSGLRKQFSEMYHILDQMNSKRHLGPATEWAQKNSTELESRGSNLEFDLVKLQFLWLFENERGIIRSLEDRRNTALDFARAQFSKFQGRHLKEIQQLIGAMAFCPNLSQSPYKHFFKDKQAWDELASTFTGEFCSLLGLSAESPVYIAATAGAIALPTLQKLQLIMETKRTEWTTQNELPVEIPLPPAYKFHSIFVCPVSKEQTTDENPPMMMPCGHVIAQDSLNRLSKMSRFKCPYCPGESHPHEATKVFL